MAKGRDEHQARLNEVSSFGKELARRCKSHCELCGENTSLAIFEVPPVANPAVEKCVLIWESCRLQVSEEEKLKVNQWHCLNETAWSEVPAVQVLAYRLLKKMDSEAWAQDLAEQLYLEEEILEWAEEELDGPSASAEETGHKDSNGVTLYEGDTVCVIKDLDVRGASFVAKRGTTVKGIHLCTNPEHIEGRVNGTKIVLKTCFLKKS